LDNAQVQGCAISPSYGRAYSSVGWQTIAYTTPSARGGSLTRFYFYVFFLTDSIGFPLEKSTFPFKQPHTMKKPSIGKVYLACLSLYILMVTAFKDEE
jgi:hypothetical protein